MNRKRISKTRAVTALAVLVALTTVTAGCMWAPELARVCRDIEAQVPGATFDKEFAVSLGPVSLAFARLLTGLVPDAREARGYLRDVSRIQIAVYETDGMPPVSSIHMPRRLQKLADEGWETAVKVREKDSVVWVMYKIDGDTIRDMYVIVLDDSELVMVKARGRLERLAAHALREAQDTPGIPRIDESAGDLRTAVR
jgi:hypothetical protein